MGATEKLWNGRSKPCPQSERCEPREAKRGVLVGGAEGAEGEEGEVLVVAESLHGAGGEAERGRIERLRGVPPLAELRVAGPQVEEERARQRGGVAHRGAHVAAVVEAVRHLEAVDGAFTGGVGRAQRPVVAVLLALVPVAAHEDLVVGVEVVVDASQHGVVVVGAELVREVVGLGTGTVGLREQRRVGRGDGVDAAGGDDVPRERRALVVGARGGVGIEDGPAELGEVALPHEHGGHGVGRRLGLDVAQALEGGQEERLVLLDGARQGGREAVVRARGLLAAGALGQQRCRRAGVAAVEVGDAAAHLVGARLQGQVHDRPRRLPRLGVERVRLHLELGDGVRRRREADHAAVVAGRRVVGRDAVGRAVQREVVAAHGAVGHDAGQVAVVHGAGEVQVGRVGQPRGQPRQHVGGAVTQRKLLDLVAVDDLSRDAGRRVQHGRLGHHHDRLFQAARLQGQVHRDHVAHADGQVLAHGGLEAVEPRGHRILSGDEVGDPVVSLAVRLRLGGHVGRHVGGGHGHSREDPAGRVRHGAGDGAAEVLRGCRSREEEQDTQAGQPGQDHARFHDASSTVKAIGH